MLVDEVFITFVGDFTFDCPLKPFVLYFSHYYSTKLRFEMEECYFIN
jgi:hypothetical protein